ncbi:hypothetical protein HW115_07950 [Verrucomicrobiaceae bacterium N1E253]|uniref:Alpha-galactosidase n=1 Tax=Oceaniferula marina TaxID=2748318 RepID=A0A851GLB6_9BACT|nr:hypothetical protein [Oceaniferula marina]NWK55540.1 hypothetical protein [Oceaniferula marina]
MMISATTSSRFTLLLCAVCVPMFVPLSAQVPANYQLESDWLLKNEAFVAEVTKDRQAGRLNFSNGLFSRSIDIRLGTTVEYTNLMTGESVIRAVEPEGYVTLDGVPYAIGGADGQKNKAFLTEPWLKNLKPREGALQLVNVATGEPEPRLKWKRVRHHAPDAVWPPKGKTIRLDYRLPESQTELSLHDVLVDSDFGRPVLLVDEFQVLDAAWKVHATKAHARANFENEGKAGEIYTLPDTVVFAERPLPAGVEVVEATIHAGTDGSTSWGPGIGLVFENGKVMKLNIRPGGLANVNRPVLGMYDGQREHPHLSGEEKVDVGKPITLRARLIDDKVLFDAQQEGGVWKHYRAVTIPESFGKAKAFRVGKMALDGGTADRGRQGELVRLRVNKVAMYGGFDRSRLDDLVKKQKMLRNLTVSVHYEIYDGVPAFSKWITVKNETGKPVNLDRFCAETLSVVEYDNQVEVRDGVSVRPPRSLHVETDMAFGGMSQRNANRHTVHWLTDKSFSTQVNWAKQNPCLLKVQPTFGPDQTIEQGETFESFRMFQLVYDSEDRERRGLALKRMYRTVAPWVTENPLMLHCKSSNEKVVKNAIDQAAATGFEMVILSFGSGFNSENDNPDYLAKWKKINDYALQKGIHLGSYSLYSSRSAGKGNDIIPPKGMKNAHGRCPAITSAWGQKYIKKLYNLFEQTGFMVFENDGTYPGDVDVTARPPLQKGVNDSRWVHWRIWTDFYKFLRARGVYFNLPDYYYLSGSNKCGMGYREVNWSLPREQQRVIARQNIYDGTWEKTPSMGWMFVPLVQYHGGGAAATIEPLHQHLDHYKLMMQSNLGLGVQACYRGPRLYDTEETKQMVTETVAWFKKHREILESDLVHGRRADGRDIDWMLHVNPKSKEKAFLSVYNPTDAEVSKEIWVPLYYAGLKGKAQVSVNGGAVAPVALDGSARVKLKVRVPAQGYGYYVFEKL